MVHGRDSVGWRNAYRILAGIPEGKSSYGSPKRKLEIDVRKDRKKYRDGVDFSAVK
jgi:hypothetical protein